MRIEIIARNYKLTDNFYFRKRQIYILIHIVRRHFASHHIVAEEDGKGEFAIGDRIDIDEKQGVLTFDKKIEEVKTATEDVSSEKQDDQNK